MKKLYTLLACVAFAGTSMAQSTIESPKIPQYSGKHIKGKVTPSNYKTKPSGNEQLGTNVSFSVDYNELEILLNNQAQFIWPVNTSSPTTHFLGRSIMALDTLIETPAFISHAWSDVISYTIDSVKMRLGHVNGSNTTNNLYFNIINLGSNDYPDIGTDAVLWSDTITTDTTLVGPTWTWSSIATFVPNLTIPNNDKVALVFDFQGDSLDTASVVFGYPHDGSSTCVSLGGDFEPQLSTLTPNSYYLLNQNNTQYPTSTGGLPGWFCDQANNTVVTGDLLQHKRGTWFVTIEECDLTTSASTVESTGSNCDGEGIVSATGTGTITYQWDGNAGNQTGATATGLCAGTYSVTITDGDGCTSVETITITPVGVDETTISKNVNVFPNPNNGNFTITLTGVKAGEYTIELVNVLGETVLTENAQINGDYTKNLNLTDLAKGVYSLTISNSTEKATQKLVVE